MAFSLGSYRAFWDNLSTKIYCDVKTLYIHKFYIAESHMHGRRGFYPLICTEYIYKAKSQTLLIVLHFHGASIQENTFVMAFKRYFTNPPIQRWDLDPNTFFYSHFYTFITQRNGFSGRDFLIHIFSARIVCHMLAIGKLMAIVDSSYLYSEFVGLLFG